MEVLNTTYASADRKWLGEAFYHHSLQPGSSQYNGTHATFLRYQTAKLNWNWNHEYVGKDYTAVLGLFLDKTGQNMMQTKIDSLQENILIGE